METESNLLQRRSALITEVSDTMAPVMSDDIDDEVIIEVFRKLRQFN